METDRQEKRKGTMTRLKKLSKWIIAALPILVLGYFAFDKFVLPLRTQSEFTGTATLSWTTPTENEDDSPLINLAGFVIHCWNEADEYTHSIYVDDPGITSYIVGNLPPGVHFCAVKAVNTDGRVSALSNAVAKAVPNME
jgi:hypothetical protein